MSERRRDESSSGEAPRAEPADPVAEAATLLGAQLAQYLEAAPGAAPADTGQTVDPDASLDEPTAAFEMPPELLAGPVAQPSAPPVPIPSVDDLDDADDDGTVADARGPVDSTAPAPPVGVPSQPAAPLAVPQARVIGPPTPTPATPRPAVAVAVARPLVVGPAAQRTPRPPTEPLVPGLDFRPRTDPPEAPEPSVILDFGGESAAVTTVFAGEPAPELPRGRLVVSGGPNGGKVWYLNRPATTVGRAQDNDIVLLDGSVSRYHLRLDRDVEGFRLVDAGSANGVWVNGSKTAQQELYDGDRILLGEMTLNFSTVGNPRARPSLRHRVTDPGRAVARPRSRRRRIPVSWVLAWVATTLVAVVVTVSVTRVVRHRRAAEVHRQAEVHRLEAVAAVEQRAWPRARTALLAARALSPELLDYPAELARLDQAQRHEAAVEGARRALAKGDHQAALERLQVVGATSPYGVDARALRRQAEALGRRTASPR